MASGFAFETTPSFADVVSGAAWAYVTRTEGVGRWAMPVCLWHSPAGFDAKDAAGADHHTLAINLAGAGVEGRRGRSWSTIPGGARDQLSVQPQHVGTDYRAHGEIRFAHLYFQDEHLRRVAAELFSGPVDRGELLQDGIPFVADRQLRAMSDQYLLLALSRSERPSALEMDSRTALICASLLRRHSVLAPKLEVRTMALAPLRLTPAKDYLEAHLAEDFSLQAVADAAELSPFHFARAFKRETGAPPHRYLMERRVERARELLAGGDMGLAEIALACGFAGQSHFTTAFKRHTGVTPGAWRQAVRH